MLVGSATALSMGAKEAANMIAVSGFYSLVTGAALQIASYAKYGRAGVTPSQTRPPETIVPLPSRRRLPRVKLAAVATVGLILLASVVVGYPMLLHQPPAPGGTSSGSSSSSSSSGCSMPRDGGTIFVSTNATVTIKICGQDFPVNAGEGGGLIYAYHSGVLNFSAPSSASGKPFALWYVTLVNTPSTRVTSPTLSLNLPSGLTSQNSVIGLFYAASGDSVNSTTATNRTTSNSITSGTSTQKLVGYWPLDEGSGVKAADLSGNGNNGILVNSPVWVSGANCMFGHCLSLANASGQYVLINNFVPPSGSFTMSAWIKTGSTSSTLPIVQDGYTGSEQGFAMLLQNHHLGCGIRSATASTLVSGNATIDDDGWHLVACAFSASAHFQPYTDGKEDGVGADSTVGATTYANGYFIGHDDAGNSWNGLIGGVRHYSYALTVPQMSQLYSSRPTTSSTISTTTTTPTCNGSDGSIFVSTSVNDAVSIAICGEQVLVPGGAGGGLVYGYHAGQVTFVAPPTASGMKFQYWLVSVPSLNVKVPTNSLRLELPAGYLWNNAVIQAVYG